MLSSLWQSYSESRPTLQKTSSLVSVSKLEEDPETLTNEDWELLLQGAKVATFTKDVTIVADGESFQRIYQIASGRCRIEKGGKLLGHMEVEDTFGEISFLLSGGATADVIADSEIVEVYIMEGYFINILFGRKPELAGRFYKYLANELQRRIRTTEDNETQAE